MSFWVAGAMIGSAVIGGIASNRAASKSAKAQQKGIDAQNALLGPYAMQGQQGLGAVQSFVDNGAQFSDTQAYKDITNASKAGGQFQSGNRATALTDYYATNFRPQRLNELMQLPTLGANAAAGQASNLGNLYTSQGNTQAAGILGMGNSATNALGNYAFLKSYQAGQPSGGGFNGGFGAPVNYGTYGGYGTPVFNPNTMPGRSSDIRLKKNIQKVGEDNGINLYTWEWNDIAIERGITDPTIGVIAQEVDPEFVTEKDGYLQVDYDGLFSKEIN